jgi:hypothetical protein
MLQISSKFRRFVCAVGVVAFTLPTFSVVGEDFSMTMQRQAGMQLTGAFTPLRFADEDGSTPFVSATESSNIILPANLAQRREEAVDIPMLYGCRIASKQSADGVGPLATGMIKFNSGTDATQLNTTALFKYGGAPLSDGNYYGMRVTNTGKKYLDKFPMTTWKRASQTSLSSVSMLASDVAYDPTSDMVYGCFYNDTGDGYLFGKVDYTTRKRTAIKNLEVSYNAVMVDAAGQVYAIDMTGNLLKVDKTTGDATTIGHTGVSPAYATSATIDLSTGRCFWTVSPADGTSYLYEVNLETGLATQLFQFACSDEITGLFIPAPEATAEAPSPAQNLTASFPEGALEGTFSFTMPTTLVNGAEATGEMNYIIWIDGVEFATGTANAGDAVTKDVALSTPGKKSFAVGVSNAAGNSKNAVIKVFIGSDTPKAPAPTLTYADGKFTISWEKVTASVNNGYMNPDQLTYTVTRLTDNVVVATDIAETSYQDEVAPTPGRVIPYQYSVKATFNGYTGAAGTTNIYPLGENETPYYEGFDSADAMNNFIILDSNGDGVTWKYSVGASSAYITNANVDHDDWLITAAMHLYTGRTYKLSYEAMASFSPEKIEVKMGREATAEAMTIQLVEPTDLEANCQMIPSVPEFTVEESGLYYIGWHAISATGMFYLYVDNISLTSDHDGTVDAITPPYTQEFSESASLSEFTVIDANEDGYLWNISNSEARVVASNGNIDDWLISPPMQLEGGLLYNVSLDAHSSQFASELLEVAYGTDPTAEAMTTLLIPTATLTETVTNLAKTLGVEEDGVYYIGIHGCSTAGYELFVDNFKVAAPVSGDAPAAVENIAIKSADYGEAKAIISFDAPGETINGGDLTTITKVEILLGEDVVATVANLTAGESASAEVSVPEVGSYTFTLVPYNEAGAGLSSEITGYIGVNTPDVVRNLTMVEDGDSGQVTLSWEAPLTDVNGVLLNPADVTYIIVDIINGQQLILVRGISETTYTIQAVGTDAPQVFKCYGVYAVTSMGNGSGVTTGYIPVGTADFLPYQESFSDGTADTIILTAITSGSGSWYGFDDNSGVASVDGDNGFVGLKGMSAGATGVIISGKISLGDVMQPKMTFYVYNLSDNTGEANDNNEIIVQIMPRDEEVATVADFVLCEAYGNIFGWHEVEVDLTEYAGKTIQFAIGAVTNYYVYSLFDNIELKEGYQSNADIVKAGEATISTLPGAIQINVTQSMNVNIADMSGRNVYVGPISNSLAVQVAPGIYVVRVGEKTVKVIVK